MAPATDKNLFLIGGQAGADLTDYQGYAVKLDGSGNVVVCDTAGEPSLGILSFPAPSGASVNYETLGIAAALAGGTFAVGDRLTTNASGKLVDASTIPGASADYIALQAGTADKRASVLCLTRGGTSGLRRTTLSFHHYLPQGASGDLVTTFPLNFKGAISALRAVVTKAGTGAGASVTINAEIGTTDLTGGVVTATLAGTATVGAVLAGTAVTGTNKFSSGDTLSIETVVGTAFTDGEIDILVDIDY